MLAALAVHHLRSHHICTAACWPCCSIGMYMLPTVCCLHELEVSSALAARYKEVQVHAARSKYSSSAIV